MAALAYVYILMHMHINSRCRIEYKVNYISSKVGHFGALAEEIRSRGWQLANCARVHILRERSKKRRRIATRKMKRRIQAYLWEFLVGLLEDDECAPFINWTNKFEKEFVMADPDEVANLWGLLKNRPKMNKTKLRRAIRQYYKRDLIMKVGTFLWFYLEIPTCYS